MSSRTDPSKFESLSRRELLKLTPVVALGAFAIPQLQKPLLKAGLGFTDWALARLFRSSQLAPTFHESDLTPFDRFPINDYDVDDPGVDFDDDRPALLNRLDSFEGSQNPLSLRCSSSHHPIRSIP